MRRQFQLNTEPHVAEIGTDIELLFQPEIYGEEFLTHYEELRASQQENGVDLGDMSGVEGEQLRQAALALKVFLAKLMLPESAAKVLRWQVVVGGKAVATHTTVDAATADAKKRKSAAKVRDASLRLPDRIWVELLEWAIDLYGGNRPNGSSGGSAPASPTPGTVGKAPSPSKASTRTRGR
ncbi:hypothetical protein [Embleya sp. NPDC001921]